jgi:hypothetical protein
MCWVDAPTAHTWLPALRTRMRFQPVIVAKRTSRLEPLFHLRLF